MRSKSERTKSEVTCTELWPYPRFFSLPNAVLLFSEKLPPLRVMISYNDAKMNILFTWVHYAVHLYDQGSLDVYVEVFFFRLWW